MAVRSALMSLLSSKRSRLLTALVCATFLLICISRLNEPSAPLFGRPRASTTPAQAPFAYNGPRFEIFGIRDFADQVEVATLNIKTAKPKPKEKVDKPLLSPPSSGSPGLSRPNYLPEDTNEDGSEQPNGKPQDLTARAASSSSSNSLEALQHALPIALPKFHPHRLDSPDFNISDLEHPPPGVPPATISLDLPSPAPQPDASSLIFGVATTLDRMPDSLRNFRHWAAHTGARFVVLHEPRNTTLRPGEPTPEEVLAMYAEAGMAELEMVERDAGWGERFVGLLGALHVRMENATQWAVLIDDDTFFLDLDVVLARLKKYDYEQDWYVGALSENKWNINNGGLYAVGGAGVFLSRGLMKTMAPHVGDCFPRKDKVNQMELPGGDVLVGACIHRHTTTKLTREHGLFQLDLHGDVTGFYEAVRAQPVSVHHWKSWHHHDLPTIAAVSQKCGRSCVLQNFRFQDGWQMSNGFSIVRYAYNETERAGQHSLAMEQTWEKTVWTVEDSWQYSLAPLKRRDEGKVQYLNERTIVGEDGSVTVFYVRREGGVGRGLIRVVWR
ncbi:hypothetical protein N0V93_006097 [Gnomoniopsis smithogilvyi]|uniref:Fringe-like glycosyltransferase domain-containing protein n=1 Tax=Gnomoniopsis smithogilvyi TaxID=1191159 RepID=A0A9W9CU69_9PEZI|nr:hypothetical protein N0V93_006097 [Gnomoniopsis smithogilvyi]